MSHKLESISTVPSGSTGSHPSRSSAMQSSSGDSSVQSRIDSSDSHRIGGPGNLPRWPLITGLSPDIDPEVGIAVVDIAVGHLQELNLEWKKAYICTRATEGSDARPIDSTTLLISVESFEERRDSIVALLDTLLTVLPGLGYTGRIEIIDWRAINGPQTFLPKVSSQQQDEWNTTLDRAIGVLGHHRVDWRQIVLANRGYWEEVSKPTVVIKTPELSTEQEQAFQKLHQDLSDQNLEVERMGVGGLWGLFASVGETVLAEQISQNLGWPVNLDYHAMGISVGRNMQNTSTLGGYLKVRQDGTEHTVGITCYNGVRLDSTGSFDEDIQSRGATALSWPCQSPSAQDHNLLLERHVNITNKPTASNQHLKSRRERVQKESKQKLEELQQFDPHVGNVVAVSGWRNREYGTGLGAPLVFVDWACIEISHEKCPYPINAIDEVADELPASFPEGLPHWKSTKEAVDTVADMPTANIVTFKRGRTTGLTAGDLGGICQAAHRIPGLPGHLHHRAYMVTTSPTRRPFGLPGDSGAWCLNGNGDVVGQLVAGDSNDGTGLVVPFKLLLNDMEDKLGLEPGSISLA